MTRTLRKIALPITIPALCALIALNAYVVFKNLKVIQQNSAHRQQASETQVQISKFLLDLQEMETGQRGYLLTGDPAYLQPYNKANDRLATHFANLRSRLTGKDRALETQLESVAEAKVAEMNETIRLRQLGYRHRAFLIVGSNRGQQLMNDARATLDALSAAQAGSVARYDREIRDGIGKAVQESALASGILLVVTVGIFLAFNIYRKRLETACDRHSEELQATSRQLERLTSTVYRDFRALLAQIREHANALLEVYGGFLPRQGQEKAECIEDGAGQMIRLLDSSVETSGNSLAVMDGQPRQKLTA